MLDFVGQYHIGFIRFKIFFTDDDMFEKREWTDLFIDYMNFTMIDDFIIFFVDR